MPIAPRDDGDERAPSDPRHAGAPYYDLQPFPDDVPFYRALIGDGQPSLLELGCGTGRVMLALSDLCSSTTGVEISAEMLDQARAKGGGATFVHGDVAAFDLGRAFDLILAPYRVFQALDSDAEVAGLLTSVRKHLAPGGSCVLTMFMPMYDPDTLRERWATDEEKPDWEVEVGGNASWPRTADGEWTPSGSCSTRTSCTDAIAVIASSTRPSCPS